MLVVVDGGAGRALTQTCTFPSVEELDAAGRKPKGGSFPYATRFPRTASTGGEGGGGGGDAPHYPSLGAPKRLDKGGFSGTVRFPPRVSANPGPGDHDLRRLFEDVPTGRGKRLTAEKSSALVHKIEEERTLRNQSCSYMASQVRSCAGREAHTPSLIAYC